MWKLGVCHPEHYAVDRDSAPRFLRQTRWAYSLLRTGIPPSPFEIQMFEGIMRYVCLARGVYRTTTRQRFDTLNAFLGPVLEARFARRHTIRVEDWAASTCITSVEWFHYLKESFPAVQLTASDLHLYLLEITLPSGEVFIVERDGDPVQYVKPPFVIPLERTESILLPVNRWLQWRARKRLEDLKTQESLELGAVLETQEECERPSLILRKIPLIHPTALALSRTEEGFRIEKHSIFDVRRQPCHVLRTMNILNYCYFQPDQLRASMRSVWASLVPGGVWIVGRTTQEMQNLEPALHQVSVFEKTRQGFALLDRHGTASEIENLALALRV